MTAATMACEPGTTDLGRTLLPPDYSVATSSVYVAMDDGVRLAVEVHRPSPGPDGGSGAVLELTRYWRATVGDGPTYRAREAVRRGVAWIVVDERGTGASFGGWPGPLTDRALDDLSAVADWVTEQPWSNGRVAAAGVSYAGWAAELLAARGHSALVAATPISDPYDLYDGVVFPGGLFNRAFVRGWSDIVSDLDRGEWPLEGPASTLKPVDGDTDRSLLASALAEHAGNPDVFDAVSAVAFRDEATGLGGRTIDEMSAHRRADRLGAAATPLYVSAGWLDGAYADGVIRHFQEVAAPQRAVIGAWSHGLDENVDPFVPEGTVPSPPLDRQWTEYLSFLVPLLQTGGAVEGKVLRYYTMGEGLWKSTATWPVEGATRVRRYLAGGGTLASELPGDDESWDAYRVDFTHRSAESNRWVGPLGIAARYADRAEEDGKLLVYESAPLLDDTEVTGYPTAELHVAADRTDAAVIVYLEVVLPDGRVVYLTEGVLRASHRALDAGSGLPRPTHLAADYLPLVPGEVTRLRFTLEPTSALVPAGARFRIAIAGQDEGAFVRVPDGGDVTLDVHRDAAHPSWVELPVVARE